jgi:hypothetical protein
MLDVPVDAPPVLVALSLVSTALLGVALAGRQTPAPEAAPLAATADAVATAEYPSVERRQLGVAAVRIEPREITVRGPGGTSYATIAYGPVTPVRRGTALWRVLHGTPPDDAFGGPFDFAAAADDARSRDAAWRYDPERLTVRRVTWRGVDVTLVGA